MSTWGRRALGEPLEGVAEQQLVAPAARADQDDADGAARVAAPVHRPLLLE